MEPSSFSIQDKFLSQPKNPRATPAETEALQADKQGA